MMGARPSQQIIKRHLNKLAKKYVGTEFRVLYASNGEVAILPVNPATGEADACYQPDDMTQGTEGQDRESYSDTQDRESYEATS